MAGRTARLSLWLVLGVLLAHALVLEWVADHLQPVTVLRPMAEPLFTRVLQPAAPPPPVAQAAATPPKPRPRRAQASNIPASATEKPKAPVEPSAPEPAPQPDQVSTPEPASASAPAEEPAPVGQAPAEPASAPAAAASAPAALSLDSWPGDTRLSYRLGGKFRSGELYGDAHVQWQREGSAYQVRVNIDITIWAHLVLISQGEVTPQGLVPRMYEELRRGKRRGVRLDEHTIAFEGGRSAPRPEGVQDAASQFVELAHRFASGRETLEVGKSVSVWLARPGGVDLWIYDVLERETIQTPHLGPVEAWRLRPRPIAKPRGNITAEMWFAPSLQYLPVRIRVTTGEEAHVDLVVDKIEQR